MKNDFFSYLILTECSFCVGGQSFEVEAGNRTTQRQALSREAIAFFKTLPIRPSVLKRSSQQHEHS